MAIKNKQGKEISRALAASGMSQGELSRRLGVSASYTSRVVNGTRQFGLKYLRALSQVLGTSLEALLP